MAPTDASGRKSSGVFLQGVPLEQAEALGWPRAKHYRAAAIKFPDVRACLINQPSASASLIIDWKKIQTTEEADVCLARVASMIGSTQGVVSWLEQHGFTKVFSRRDSLSNTHYLATERSGDAISAFWSIKNNGPLINRSAVTSMVERWFSSGIHVVVYLSDSGRVVSVNCTTNIL